MSLTFSKSKYIRKMVAPKIMSILIFHFLKISFSNKYATTPKMPTVWCMSKQFPLLPKDLSLAWLI